MSVLLNWIVASQLKKEHHTFSLVPWCGHPGGKWNVWIIHYGLDGISLFFAKRTKGVGIFQSTKIWTNGTITQQQSATARAGIYMHKSEVFWEVWAPKTCLSRPLTIPECFRKVSVRDWSAFFPLTFPPSRNWKTNVRQIQSSPSFTPVNSIFFPHPWTPIDQSRRVNSRKEVPRE